MTSPDSDVRLTEGPTCGSQFFDFASAFSLATRSSATEAPALPLITEAVTVANGPSGGNTLCRDCSSVISAEVVSALSDLSEGFLAGTLASASDPWLSPGSNACFAAGCPAPRQPDSRPAAANAATKGFKCKGIAPSSGHTPVVVVRMSSSIKTLVPEPSV